MTFISHLECSYTGKKYTADIPHNLSEAGKPLLARYDLDAVSSALTKEMLGGRSEGFWRYRELLPVSKAENRISLGEIVTPLVKLPRLAQRLNFSGDLTVKDEGRLPTGSFKARGLGLAVSMAKEFGLEHLAMPTNGNAGSALAAYAKAAGMRATVFCPDDTPRVNIDEIAFQGADVYCVNGLIGDCGKIVGEGQRDAGWFDVSTLKEPYRVEGKKTMGLELAEQFGWELPDAIFYPTGGGTGLIGMAKAFDELEAMGWIGSKRPKLIVVQAAGCAPIVKAWQTGAEHAEPWENAHTAAAGIRVPAAIGDFLILRAVRDSNGFAIAVEEDDIFAARTEVSQSEGLLLCPEGAATYAAFKQALAKQWISPGDKVVLFNCATGLKYPMTAAPATIDKDGAIDFSRFR
ncbi:threonine synthase [Hyphococcus sp.]|uniref:threonine synthase n=1 Tax=Hyphococcus sp. TaxID=2038636 RepID=UPI003CCBBF05